MTDIHRSVLRSTRPLVLCFMLFLLEVRSQSYPSVSFMGEYLANHSYVNFSLVGSDEASSVQCHTDLKSCCSSSQGPHQGDWYFPNQTRLPFTGEIYESHGDQRVTLHCSANASSLSGIYHCDIPINGVDDDDIIVTESVYIGMYPSGEGKNTCIPCFTNECLLVDCNG